MPITKRERNARSLGKPTEKLKGVREPVKRSALAPVRAKANALAPVRAKAKALPTAGAHKTLTTAAKLPERERLTDYLAVRMTTAERAHADAKGGSTWVRSLIAKSLAREGKA